MVLNQLIYLNLLFSINTSTLTETCICIGDFGVLRVDITLSPILKSKNLVKLLSSLEKKKDVITNLKSKHINRVQVLKSKKILLLNNFNLAYILNISKKS